ncbi:MAG: GTPase HflX [Candidatus Tectomicrobia bacterium]|nr:GTPase HflX [Candidatus Tectomicrobia bacterium]
MPKLHGNLTGLKPSQVRRIENIHRRRLDPRRIITPELAAYLAELSRETGRQLGVLVDRGGKIEAVVVGDAHSIVLPDLKRQRRGSGRFRGLRCLHTHLRGEPLTQDDLTDLALLRLDLMLALQVGEDGLPGAVVYAHLVPLTAEGAGVDGGDGEPWRRFSIPHPNQLTENFLDLVRALEEEFARAPQARDVRDGRERAILVGVAIGDRGRAEESLAELRELARSANILVLDSVLQRRKALDPRFLIGRGKLDELIIRSLRRDADVILFDHNLTPGQERMIADRSDLAIIDRTQLILDIFAQRARSRDGKLQVELAQLRYLLPRLVEKDTAMSRLTGGIGTRGPGETKLEINRRRVRSRIQVLERALAQLSRERQGRRARRLKGELPILSIVGYTNAGKSTLLNALTKSTTPAENRLFSTLDPVSRRLRFPRDREVILTDTVGFLRDLPPDLVAAFSATLEELHDADLLLHVADASDPALEKKIEAVDRLLESLELHGIPRLLVLNKMDATSPETLSNLQRRYDAVATSALDPSTFGALLRRLQEHLWARGERALAAGEGRDEDAWSDAREETDTAGTQAERELATAAAASLEGIGGPLHAAAAANGGVEGGDEWRLANQPVEAEPAETEELRDGGEDKKDNIRGQQPDDDLARVLFMEGQGA